MNIYLKAYFKQNKKHGSKDRKSIAALCYNYFRLGHAVKNLQLQERIMAGSFIVETNVPGIIKELKHGWKTMFSKSESEKIDDGFSISAKDIFLFEPELSRGIDSDQFALSILKQPDVFVRVRPGKEKFVKQKLANASLTYKEISSTALAFPNNVKLDGVLKIDSDVVIQDLNSQRVGDFLPGINSASKKVWDCCAASGGKSIMVYDRMPGIQLTVSDKRSGILENLKTRFRAAAIYDYEAFVLNLTSGSSKNLLLQKGPFDLIMVDAPCTGSGTWARTPEQLYFFKKNKIAAYSEMQREILTAVIPRLKTSGYLLYSTCSVFSEENEEIVDFIKDRFHLKLVKMELLKGYELNADTLFAALFILE